MELKEFLTEVLDSIRSQSDRLDELQIQEFLSTFEEIEEDVYEPHEIEVILGTLKQKVAKILFRDLRGLRTKKAKISFETNWFINDDDKIEVGLKNGLHQHASHISVEMEMEQSEPNEIFKRLEDKLLETK